jgi:predicted TPR repeat methyltransferase
MQTSANSAVLKKQALVYFRAGKLAEAKAVCAEICRQVPGDAETWHLLTAINGMLGLYAETEACARRVIALQPGFHGAYNNLGHALRELKKEEEAKACFEHALTLKPNDAEALNHLGMLWYGRGDYLRASEYFRQALVSNPGYAEAENNLGNALQNQSKPDESLMHYQRALRLRPQFAQAQINIGNLLLEQNKYDDALMNFQQVLSWQPSNESALLGMAEALRQKGKLDETIAVLRQVIGQNPDCAQAHFCLGQLFMLRNRNEEALQCFQQALRIDPENAITHFHFGSVYRKMGQIEKSMASLREALRINPDHSAAKLLLAGLGGIPAPERPGTDYVTNLFDGYAENFEQHLVNGLEYRIPWVLQTALLPLFDAPRGSLDVLDMGCGTGLCGEVFRPWARTLTGVDLSPKMIKKAQARGVYDELVVGDLLVPLKKPGALFDLILATDVFIYVGALEEIFTACKAGLRPRGMFAFSVEGLEGEGGYVVRPTMRYAHSVAYIQKLAEISDFRIYKQEKTVIRMHEDKPLDGYVFVLGPA